MYAMSTASVASKMHKAFSIDPLARFSIAERLLKTFLGNLNFSHRRSL
jgi:hypothetical protein